MSEGWSDAVRPLDSERIFFGKDKICESDVTFVREHLNRVAVRENVELDLRGRESQRCRNLHPEIFAEVSGS